MQPLERTLKDGAALHRELEALLVDERGALARHEVAGGEAANARRGALVQAIADWEREAAGRLDSKPSGPHPPGAEGPATLRAAVAALPEPERPAAEAALKALAASAVAARHAAAVNHIVLERNLDIVTRTLDLLTGRPSGTTYGPQGGVSRAPGGGLVGRKE